MGKNIVILFDGTSNQPSPEGQRSNILRLYGCLEKSEHQLVWYDPGVGTIGAEKSWLRFWRKTVEVFGMVTGWGLDDNVKEAYRFLVEQYRAGGEGEAADNIYLAGFSRGAYSARVLAGFIHNLGLVDPRNLNLLDYLLRAYKSVDPYRMKQCPVPECTTECVARAGARHDGCLYEHIRLYERTLQPARPRIKALLLFDTVASVVESRTLMFIPRTRSHANIASNPSVDHVLHAVSIEERRSMFHPVLWQGGQGGSAIQQAEEVWFAGVHADVGGGYAESESALAKYPLHWIMECSQPLGLKYRSEVIRDIVLGLKAGYSKPAYVASDVGREHESMNWGWALLEFLPRRKPARSRRPSLMGYVLPLFEPRRLPPDARLHWSAKEFVNSRGRPFRQIDCSRFDTVSDSLEHDQSPFLKTDED